MCLLNVRWLSNVIQKFFIEELQAIGIFLILILLHFLVCVPSWIAEDLFAFRDSFQSWSQGMILSM